MAEFDEEAVKLLNTADHHREKSVLTDHCVRRRGPAPSLPDRSLSFNTKPARGIVEAAWIKEVPPEIAPVRCADWRRAAGPSDGAGGTNYQKHTSTLTLCAHRCADPSALGDSSSTSHS